MEDGFAIIAIFAKQTQIYGTGTMAAHRRP